MRCRIVLSLAMWVFTPFAAPAAGNDLRAEAAQTLHRAVEFFRTKVAVEGGYLWRYSEDLSRREGEGKATASMVWVQHPGTPSIGAAFLAAYRATDDRYYLDAAREAGRCLLRGQLRSGGWDYRITFDPQRRGKYAYRVDTPADTSTTPFNTTTLDDKNTQGALDFLMELDQTLQFQDPQIHEAALFGLKTLLDVQYPNGAWPQRFSESPDPSKHPVKKAEYPADWPRAWPNVDYKPYYTFNDNTIADTIDTMLRAAEIYREPRYRAAAEKGGGFVLLAQMPEPQPAWAQQYNAQMQPAWARKFEPPAVTGGESQGALRILLRLYRETGNPKYLTPIPTALAYLKRSLLPDGQLARFYELKTNRPLYFTRKYELTYADYDLPTHYGFKVPSRLEAIEQEYQHLKAPPPKKAAPPATNPHAAKKQSKQVAAVIAALDNQGRWVEDGELRYHGDADPTRRVIDCHTFIVNVRALSKYLEATR